MIKLYSSKTHSKESEPQTIKIEALSILLHTAAFCPFEIVHKYIVIQGNYNTFHEPLFIFQGRCPVTPHHTRSRLKEVLMALHLDPDLYGMHSLRAGRATDMYKLGYSLPEIRESRPLEI